MHFLVLNLLMWYLPSKFPLLSVDYTCSLWKMFHDCWLQPFLTCPWLSHGTNISNNSAKSSQGRGYLLVGDVSSWRCCPVWKILFVKRQKNRNCSSVSLLYQYMSNAMCYYTRRSSLTWLVLHKEENICSVMWCPVQYSQQPTSIIVLHSICFIA